MKRRILSMVLAIAMVASMFAGITLFASAEGSYVKANAIAVGDSVVIAIEAYGKELTEFSTTSTTYGVASDADMNMLSGSMTFTIEEGASENTYAFKCEGGYMTWTSGNSLKLTDTVSANSSWSVTIDEADDATILNANTPERQLLWNNGSPRFACYTGKTPGNGGFYAPQLYKLDVNACSHGNATSVETTPAACEVPGVATWNCPDCQATWTTVIPALEHDYDEGVIDKEPSCEEAGFKTSTCMLCGKTSTQEIDAIGHAYNEEGVCANCGDVKVVLPFEKTNTIAVGDQVIFITEKSGNEMVSVTGIGNGLSYIDTGITGAMVFEVVAGASEGTYAFVNEMLYLAWYSDNSLTTANALDANSSWTVSFDENGNAAVVNAADTTRQIWWNVASPRFACYINKSDGNSFNAIQLYKLTDGSCNHANASSEITTAATCTTEGVMTWTCECGETWTTVIEATGHTTSVSIVDGNVVLVCSVCSNSESLSLNTIAEAKAFTDKTVVYNVKGVVTYVNGRTVYIEDANDGLCVYFPMDLDTSALKLGDEIFVSATMDNYKGLLELKEPAEYYVLSSGNTVPANTDVTVADLLADTTNTYLGERVTLSELTVGTVNEDGATTLTDESGDAITLYKASGLSDVVSSGDIITITAIVSSYNGYQLLVNPGTINTDIVVTGQGEQDEVKTVAIAEAKAGTTGQYYQVQGVVTAMSSDKRTIYIQDATAGIALYLTAKPSEAVCAVGDMVQARGSWKVHNGLIELSDINAADEAFFKIISSENEVEAQNVEIVDLAIDFDNEYLSEKVRIEGACITNIASNGTVTLSQNGTMITIYRAPALGEFCTVGAIVNVTAVVSTYNGYQLLINEAADVEYVGACAHEKVTVIAAVAATCTTDGLTEGAKCAVCGEIVTAQETVPATGHNNSTVSNGDGTHTTTCANCNESSTAACTYVDGVCSGCGAEEPSSEPTLDASIKISHTLNLASDISINFAVATSMLSNYDSYYLECVIPTYAGNVLTGSTVAEVQPTISGNYYYFTLTGITAIQMGDQVEAKLHMTKGDEKFVSNVDVYSVSTYAYSQLNKEGAADTLKALCADLLRYGSSAQVFKAYRTDSLVDAAMTDAMKAHLSDIDSVTFNNNKGDLNDFENPAVSWVGRGLDLNSKVIVKFVFKINDPSINVEDLSARVTFVNYMGEEKTMVVENAEVYNPDAGYYAFNFDGLLAAELRSVLNAVVYNGDTRLSSTSIYSVDTYGNGRTGDLLTLCKAMIAYSDTALAYFNNK